MTLEQSKSTFQSSSEQSVIGGNRTFLLGDDDPQDFDFADALDAKDVLALIERSGKARKIWWQVDQAFKLGIEFKKDQPVTAPKFDDENFRFETFMDWLKWNRSWMEIIKGVKWSQAFGLCINLFFTEDDVPKGMYKATKIPFFDETTDAFTSTKAVYKKIDSIGYELIETEEDVEKTPKIYHIVLKDNQNVKGQLNENIEYYIHASRVAKATAPQVRLDREGNSALDTAAKYIQVQDQILKATFAVANNLQSGVQAIRVAGFKEATAMKGQMDNNKMTRLLKLWYSGELPLDDIFKMIVPDLKTGQLTELYMISQKEIATGLGISIKDLGEEDVPMGFGIGGKEEGEMITQNRVHHIQNHYSRFLEECFYKLGKEETSFEWVQPEIEEKSADFNIDVKNQGGDKDDPNLKESNGEEKVADKKETE